MLKIYLGDCQRVLRIGTNRYRAAGYKSTASLPSSGTELQLNEFSQLRIAPRSKIQALEQAQQKYY